MADYRPDVAEMLNIYTAAQALHLRPSEVEQLTNWEWAVLRVGAAWNNAQAKAARRAG